MAYMNPIVRTDSYKYKWTEPLPTIPNGAALILYNHESKDNCRAYLQDNTVFAEEIKKRKFDRLVHVSLNPFEFQNNFKFYFSDGNNQFVEITYKFVVSVRPDKDSVKKILKDDITDISEPIIEKLDFELGRAYGCLDLSTLETDVLSRIKDLVSRITFLKVQVSHVSSKVDDVSQKRIDDDKADKLREADVEAIGKKLERDKEEADARKREAEIARKKSETEKELAEIRRQAELEEQQHEINKNTKKVEAEQRYQLQQAENAAVVAAAQMKNIQMYGEESLAAIDPTYQKHIESHQAAVDRERDNKLKDLELAKQKIQLIKEMVETGVIDDMTAGQMTQQLLLGDSAPPPPPKAIATTADTYSDAEILDISEVKNADV